MKNVVYILLLSITVVFGQVNVETITPQIEGSGGLSLDTEGNLYIADFGDFLSIIDPDGLPNDILKLDTNQNLTTYSTGFVGASGNDFDSNGVLFQSDIRASGIYKIVGGIRTFITSTGISAPVGIAFDSNDNFYICNCGNNTIQKVTPGNVSTQFASGTLFSCPNGITIDEDDNLYVSNFNNGNIIKITPSGVSSLVNVTPGGTTGGPSNGHLDYFQPKRTLFIASHGSNKIFYIKLDDPSNLQFLAGSGVRGNDDGDANSASFSRPNGVAVTQTGDSIYINSAVPVTNVPNGPLNPQLIRLITGVNDVLSVSDQEISFFNIKTYPNPAINAFILEADIQNSDSIFILEVNDLQGKLVKEMTNIRTVNNRIKISIDVSKFKSGLYFYTLRNKSKKLFTGKIVKN